MLHILKWTATALMVPAAYLTQINNSIGPVMLYAAGILWLIAALQMRDRALIATNAVMFVAGTAGVIERVAT